MTEVKILTAFVPTHKGEAVFIHISLSGLIETSEIPKVVKEVKKVEKRKSVVGKPVIISGRLPVWLYVAVADIFHPHRWIATYDPRIGGGVVAVTHDPKTKIGEVIPVEFPFEE